MKGSFFKLGVSKENVKERAFPSYALKSFDGSQDPKEEADLKCFFAHSGSSWLRLAPIKVEMKNKEPYLVVLRELMYPHECDNITAFLGPRLGFPPGRMSSKNRGKNDWTMKK